MTYVNIIICWANFTLCIFSCAIYFSGVYNCPFSLTRVFFLFCFFINNSSHIPHRKWKAPLKNILYLVKCIRSSISSVFVFVWKFPEWIFPVLMWAGFSLGLLHCCHLEISLHCHPRTFFCFSSVFDAVSRIPYILLSWFMSTWYFVLEILDWESFPSEFWRN